MTRSVSSWLALALAISLSLPAHALQVIEGAERELAHARISLREMTRIAVDDARVKYLRYREGDLIFEQDDELGQVFIRPADFSAKPINVFVSDSKGRTFGLLLEPADVPAESILLKDRGALRKSGGTKLERAGNYDRVIKNMVLAMAGDEAPTGMEIREVRNDIPLWAGTKLTMVRVYLAAAIAGERYILTNTGTSPITIAEQELFRKGVLAVSIEVMNLAPGDSTNVYVVRERRGDE